MSIVQLHLPAATPFAAAFARIVRSLTTAAEVFAEAQAMAREAHRKYPFVAW